MAHSHQVVDDDKRFIIDSATRTISNPATNKLILIQHDHNSERFTFELDKVIEGHDMTQCNCVQVHYINYAEKSREKNAGVYDITDVETNELNKDKIIFTWLISDYATRYAGSLQFLIKFACLDADDITTYSWHTDIYKDVTISTGIENSEIITSPLPDIIATWKEDIYNTNYAYEAAKDHGFTGTEEEWLLSLHGADGLSAYELAVKNGYTGTEQQWLDSFGGSLSNYATKTDVNQALSSYPTKTELNTTLGSYTTNATFNAHTHGNITNDGKIGSTANRPLFTDTGGAITTKSASEALTAIGGAPMTNAIAMYGASNSIDVSDNTEYLCYTPLTSLTLTFPSYRFECWLTFTTESGFTLSVPDSAKYIGDIPTFKANTTYEMSIKNKVIIFGEVVTE